MFFIVGIDKIFIIQQWYHTNFIRGLTTTDVVILYKFTDEEWGDFFNVYIARKLQNTFKFPINTVSPLFLDNH